MAVSSRFHLPYKDALNEEQFQVVTQGDGYCLVLAGAGSGKTRTVVYRVAYLLEKGVAPESILLVTFTNKAAFEMMERLRNLHPAMPSGVQGGTFHSLCARWLRKIGGTEGRNHNFTIIDADDVKNLIGTIVKEVGGEADKPKPAVIATLFSFCRNAEISLEVYIRERHTRWRPYIAWILQIYELYELRKRQANVMDFDDLLALFLLWLKNNPEHALLFAQQFHYILVDEFQDTNRLQAQIVQRLSLANNNLLVVGDDAQSIYSFRAADISNILTFPEHHPNVRVFKLESNYRSTPEIVALANEIITRNTDQFPKKLTGMKPSGDKPTILSAFDASTEAVQIAQLIQSNHRVGVRLQDQAVLFRAAFHAQQLELELARRGISYEFRGGMRFFDRAHVKDMLAVMRIIANPADEISWRRFLMLLPGIGEASAQKITNAYRIHTWETLPSLTPVKGKAGQVLAKAMSWLFPLASKQHSLSPHECISHIQEAWYDAYLENTYSDVEERLGDITQLQELARKYPDIQLFVSELALQESLTSQQDTSHHDRLVLSTIHQAKGLEWSHVYIIHLNDGSFPSQRAFDEAAGLAEERRLFYVAVTRAREALTLSYPLISFGGISTTASMFIREIPEDLVMRASSPSTKTSYNNPSDISYEPDEGAWNSSHLGFAHRKHAPQFYLD